MKYCEGLTFGESNVYGVTVCGNQMATTTKNVEQTLDTLSDSNYYIFIIITFSHIMVYLKN